MSKGVPAPDATLTAAAYAYLAGQSTAAVSAAYGVGYIRLRRRVQELGGAMRSRNHHRVPNTVRDQAAALYAAGGSYDGVAAALGISPATVAAVVAERGIDAHPTGGTMRRRFSDAEAQELLARKRRGESFKAMARELGTSDQCVGRAVARVAADA